MGHRTFTKEVGGRELAKRKKYLQNLYYWIRGLTRTGAFECLPVYARGALIGDDPTVVYNLRRVRRRAPWLHVAKRKRRENNLESLPPGPWISTYVVIGRRSPLREVLERADPQEMREKYIIPSSPPKVKIFQLVADLSAALRQTDHIFARYLDELEKSEATRQELATRLAVEGSRLSDQEAMGLRVQIASVDMRKAQIQRIGADRAARDFALQFVLRESFLRLQGYTKAIDAMARNVSRRREGFDRRDLLTFLGQLDTDLTFFASKEITVYRGAARRELHRIIRDEEHDLTKGQIVSGLFRIGQQFRAAMTRLSAWSQSLAEEEERKSATLRRLIA